MTVRHIHDKVKEVIHVVIDHIRKAMCDVKMGNITHG